MSPHEPIYLWVDSSLPPSEALREARTRGIGDATLAYVNDQGTVLESSMIYYNRILDWWQTGQLRKTRGARL